MAKKPKTARYTAATYPPAEDDTSWVNTDAAQRRPPSAEARDAVLCLARLVGRQIACEQFERGWRRQRRPRRE